MIFTNAKGVEQGYINASSFEMAFGANQDNGFELQLSKLEHCCEGNSLIYVENTDIGGVVDEIYVSSDSELLSYKGRSFYGVLQSKILSPKAYYGELNSVLGEIINDLGLNNLFMASADNSGITIVGYEFTDYMKGYTAIIEMLQSVETKLILQSSAKGVKISAMRQIDYSTDEYSDEQYSLSVNQSFNKINHLVILKKDENGAIERTIHLFVNENGGIQPYSNSNTPLKDKDYILDQSNQVFFGNAEYCDILEASGGVTYNYVVLSKQPVNWNSKIENFFELDDEGNFKPLSLDSKSSYAALTSQPSDWNNNFASYFEKSLSTGEYVGVEGNIKSAYVLLKAQPSKWSQNYEDYFEYYSDGLTESYNAVSSINQDKYIKQTKKPSDWNENFNKYYSKNKQGKYVEVIAVGAPKWQSNTYYKKIKNRTYELLTSKPFDWDKNYKSYYYKKNGTHYNVEGANPPTWKANRYYTKATYHVAPKWQSGKYYQKKSDATAPAFVSGKYFKKTSEYIVPAFKPGCYYEQVEDNYAQIVDEGIKYLNEVLSIEKLDIDITSESGHDVGDTITGVEKTTGITVTQQIIAKRYSLNSNGEFEESYEMGVL